MCVYVYMYVVPYSCALSLADVSHICSILVTFVECLTTVSNLCYMRQLLVKHVNKHAPCLRVFSLCLIFAPYLCASSFAPYLCALSLFGVRGCSGMFARSARNYHY